MTRWLQAALKHNPFTPPDKTDKTDETSQAIDNAIEYPDFRFRQNPDKTPDLEVLSEELPEIDAERGLDPEPNRVPEERFIRPVGKTANPVLRIMERLEDDMQSYAEALRSYGPMSYGQAMSVLGWGATRAGQAETDLRNAGLIEFNKLGRAVLVEGERHD